MLSALCDLAAALLDENKSPLKKNKKTSEYETARISKSGYGVTHFSFSQSLQHKSER